MMRISAKAEYACLAVVELARASGGSDAPTRVRDLARAQEIPERYLIQILLQLKAAGLVHSSRGSIGGYHLSRSPSTISVAEVIAAVDGRREHLGKSQSKGGRILADLLNRAAAAEWDILSSATIAHIAEIELPNDWVL